MIHLQRHTRPHVAQGICYGQTDVPLHPDTRELETASVLESLDALSFSKVYTSPLQRCRLLAEAICLNKGLEAPTVDPRLMEMNFGKWELCSWQAIFESSAGKAWFGNFMEQPTPQGESFADVLARATDFFRSEKLPSDALIVTHDGFIRAALVCHGLLDTAHAFDERYPYGILKELPLP